MPCKALSLFVLLGISRGPAGNVASQGAIAIRRSAYLTGAMFPSKDH